MAGQDRRCEARPKQSGRKISSLPPINRKLKWARMLFTCRMMEERIFSHENGRFRNWWYADLYDGLIVFYSPFRDGEKGAAPVKAWRRYSQVWRSEA